MAKKSKNTASVVYLRNVILGLLTLFLAFVVYNKIDRWLKHSPYFTIREVYCDPSLEFLRTSPLLSLKGKNLFTVDLEVVQRQLQARYPEISELKLVKRFPDRVLVMVQRRVPFARLLLRGKTVVLDEGGTIVSTASHAPELPLVSAGNLNKIDASLGSTIRKQELGVALKIIRAFSSEGYLDQYTLKNIDLDNLSQVYFYIDGKDLNELKIITDSDNVRHRMRVLGLVLNQARSELPTVKYIDLRFKEPILGKK